MTKFITRVYHIYNSKIKYIMDFLENYYEIKEYKEVL